MAARGHRGAHEVVGLYGDPDTTWGIALEAGLRGPVDPVEAGRRLADLAAAHPHLGVPEPVTLVPEAAWVAERARVLAAPYLLDGPRFRVGVRMAGSSGSSAPTRVLVGAHHGVCDGLGLLAILAAAVGTDVVPTAAGIGARPPAGGFLRRAPRRLLEAVARPPARFASHHPVGSPGEVLEVRRADRTGIGTVTLCVAIAGAFDDLSRPDRPPGSSSSPMLFVGASRRQVGTVAPDRQTAYLRFRVDPRWSPARTATEFAAVAPEPDFPETSVGGVAPRLLRVLRSRLGSTAVVSNLGPLAGEVAWISMYPALSGPRAVSFGLASTEESTTLSLRTRSHEIGPDDAREILDAVVSRLDVPPSRWAPQ